MKSSMEIRVDYILQNVGVSEDEIGKTNEAIHSMIIEIRDAMDIQIRNSTRNRLMCYWMLLNDIQSRYSEDKEARRPEETQEEKSEEMSQDKFEDEMRGLERVKDKICQCIEDEKEGEKKVKQVLDQMEHDHPLLFQIILFILSSVIVGLLTNYIWEGIHLDQVAIYSSPDVSEPVYSEIDAENVKLIQSEEDSEFYRVIVIEGEKEKAIGYIKEDDVVKFLENDED
ncbi:hypothetical protein [Mediterraneibacter glycyrrhizinilyticus]|uniref:hypothetical protein n=1 Tax=Mediterraneibacter glycyrrhizinilyticus TaxID=342942 RepID=UPI001960834D|nr:hypothetical protein [Mediterraneibacter glycyrrhizinilyticus]